MFSSEDVTQMSFNSGWSHRILIINKHNLPVTTNVSNAGSKIVSAYL